MNRKDFEDKYFNEIAELAENLYNTYCHTVYKLYKLDYPEWGYLSLDTGNLFWDTAITLYMQELEYLEEKESND